jgi:hypothetical protein
VSEGVRSRGAATATALGDDPGGEQLSGGVNVHGRFPFESFAQLCLVL